MVLQQTNLSLPTSLSLLLLHPSENISCGAALRFEPNCDVIIVQEGDTTGAQNDLCQHTGTHTRKDQRLKPHPFVERGVTNTAHWRLKT